MTGALPQTDSGYFKEDELRRQGDSCKGRGGLNAWTFALKYVRNKSKVFA